MKKILVFILSCGLVFSSYTNIAAAQPEQTDNNIVAQNNGDSNKVDPTKFRTMAPGDIAQNGFSASVIFNSFSAERLDDGSVILKIKETFHTVRGYYEHLATDIKGEYFIPSKNSSIYSLKEGTHLMILPATTVSFDGYVYIEFSFAPVGGNTIIYMESFKIPVN